MKDDPRTVNYGRAGGYLDATKHIERAKQRVPVEVDDDDIERMLQEAEAWANGAWEA